MNQLKESCWKNFWDNKNKCFLGKKFEQLIKLLLEKQYGENIWIQTPPSWDGKKDFFRKHEKNGKTSYDWAECKMYQTAISINVLAPTLIMSTLNPINELIFFSYSPLNKNAKDTLADFSSTHQKSISIFDDVKLEALILKLLDENELEHFFYQLPHSLNSHSSVDLSCLEKIYVSGHDASYSPYEFKTTVVKLYELLVITAVIENNSTEHIHVRVVMDLQEKLETVDKSSCLGEAFQYYEGPDKKLYFESKISIKPGEITNVSFPLQIVKFMQTPCLPKINIFRDNELRCSLTSKFRLVWLVEAPLIGYQNELEQVDGLFMQKGYAITILSGCSGAGKTRLSKEIYHRYLLKNSEGLYINPIQNNQQCKLWLRKVFSKLYALPLVKVENLNYVITGNSDSELVMSLIYDDEFLITENIQVLSKLLLKKLSQNKQLLVLDDIQNFDDTTQKFVNELLNFVDMFHNINLLLIFNLDRILPGSLSNSLYHRLNDLISETEHYKYIMVNGFSSKEAEMYIRYCLDLPYFTDDASFTEQNYYIQAISQTSQNIPLFLEQILIHLNQNKAIECSGDHFRICDNNIFKKCLKVLPHDISKYFDSRIHQVYTHFPEDWCQIKDSIRLILFFHEIPQYIFESIIESKSTLNILASCGLIKIEKRIFFYHQLIESYFNAGGYYMTKALMKKCIQVLKENMLENEYPAQYYICYLKCNKGTKKIVLDALQELLDEMIPDDHVLDYAEVLMSAIRRQENLFTSNVPLMIHFFTSYCYGLTRKKSYSESLTSYNYIYQNFLQKYTVFKQAGYAYCEFMKNYLNCLLVVNQNQLVIKYGEELLGQLNHMIFTGNEKTRAASSLYNRLHVAYNRVQEHLPGKPYSLTAINYLNKALKLAVSCNDTRRIIQNELDYGNIYYNFDTRPEKAKLHWENAWNTWKTATIPLDNWKGNIYYHKALGSILSQNYDEALFYADKVILDHRKTLLNPFYFIKANFVKALVALMSLNKEQAFECIDYVENICQTYDYSKGYPICSFLRATAYETLKQDKQQAFFYYKKALNQYYFIWNNKEEQKQQKTIFIQLALKIRSFHRLDISEENCALKYPELSQDIFKIVTSRSESWEEIRSCYNVPKGLFWCEQLQINIPNI